MMPKNVLSLGFVAILLLVSTAQGNDVKVLYTNGWGYHQYFSLEENLTPDKTLRFSVKCARDAHILLAPNHDPDQPVYEVVLGALNNTMNHIRGRCPCQVEPSTSVRTVNLLSSHEFRNFWVKIASDKLKTAVQVGLGDSDTPFHEWKDPRPLRPLFLSFRSATPGTWRYGFRDANYDIGLSADRKQSVVIPLSDFGQFLPLSDHVSHSEDAVTLYFTARTTRELKILLSPAVTSLGDVYLIGIRADGAYIRRQILGDNSAAFQQPGFLNGREKHRFWIKITRDGIIMLGKGGTTKPVLQWRDPAPISPQFLSFMLNNENLETEENSVTLDSADIQYGLGPEYSISSQECTARWKGDGFHLPPGAVRGGRFDDKEIYVCRADHEGYTIPGTYEVEENNQGVCYISYNSSFIRKTQFEILTGCKLKWVAASKGHIPEGSIVAGYERDEPKYFVARVKHEGVLLLGMLKAGQHLAHVPFSGEDLPFTHYETLVQIASDTPSSLFLQDDAVTLSHSDTISSNPGGSSIFNNRNKPQQPDLVNNPPVIPNRNVANNQQLNSNRNRYQSDTTYNS